MPPIVFNILFFVLQFFMIVLRKMICPSLSTDLLLPFIWNSEFSMNLYTHSRIWAKTYDHFQKNNISFFHFACMRNNCPISDTFLRILHVFSAKSSYKKDLATFSSNQLFYCDMSNFAQHCQVFHTFKILFIFENSDYE